MDGISVSRPARNSGIGTKLINELKNYTCSEDYRSICLAVIGTNPAAKRLYERLGFVAAKTTKFRCWRWLLGFSAATTLECTIGSAADPVSQNIRN